MTDRPIIFSAPMVQALLAGRKTMTRRLAWRGVLDFAVDPPAPELAPSPWQKVRPGDRLWVREAWNLFALSQDGDCSWPVKEIPKRHPGEDDDGARGVHVIDYATGGLPGHDSGKGPWRSSRYMPRWASRLTLTVTAVRVERLQNITEGDVEREGIAATICLPQRGDAPPRMRDRFAALWNHLHGPGAWDGNPEVVALTFTVAQRNIGGGGAP